MNECEKKQGSDGNHDSAMIVFPVDPVIEKLKSEIEKLRTQLSMLVIEHDELALIECKHIEMAYMLAVGGLEYKVYETECAILRLKRKVELIQAKKNRQEKIEVSKIEEILDSEFADHKAKLEARVKKMNASLQRSRGRGLTEKEILEHKKLYRAIVKSLHPDLNPHLSETMAQLFRNAVTAYEDCDLERLRIISAMVADPALPVDVPDGMARLVSDKERLAKLIETVKDDIARIKTEYPYTMKAFVNSPEKINARKTELEGSIKLLNETLEAYTKKIEEMLR